MKVKTMIQQQIQQPTVQQQWWQPIV